MIKIPLVVALVMLFQRPKPGPEPGGLEPQPQARVARDRWLKLNALSD